ncbi:MAG TPA: DUF4214 domain-containing protein, partial [Desulfuromonadales bacterium]|nr:DUF4214 domain-containing protein [Desulfuromonadales bacterium]
MAYTDYLDQVQSIFIAYYGRPADPAGLKYWAERLDAEGGNLDAIIDAFGTSAEAEELFGGMTNEATVNTLYNQMFDRDADPAGLEFYVGQLESGEMTLSSIALDIYNGAQNDDAVMLANKLAVANDFTASLDTDAEINAYAGDDAAAAARDMLATVDADTDPQTFYGVDNTISQIVGGSVSGLFTLTESVVDGEAAVAPVTAIYWGYNPNNTEDDNSTEG